MDCSPIPVNGPGRDILDLLIKAKNDGFGYSGRGLSFTEVVRHVGLEPQATHRACTWLHHQGLVRRFKRRGRRIFALTELALESDWPGRFASNPASESSVPTTEPKPGAVQAPEPSTA